ncbi:MAG: hypothetical protein U9Q81_08925 [Pseudomonadota bacterium]|nr:hypothetical protein [Pseudomonadota bacterium]
MGPSNSLSGIGAVKPVASWTLKLDYNTHFVSYGADIWGGGSNWRSSRIGTFNPSLELVLAMEPVSIYAGAWADVNRHGVPQYGDTVQEIDVWLGIGYRQERFDFGVTYQEWYYLEQTERIVDTWLFFDDTGLLIEDFAFTPSLLVHSRVSAKFADSGSVLELRLDPGFSPATGDTSSLRLSIPVRLGFLEKGFSGGDAGFGYASIGVQLSQPLTFITSRYGDWYANGGLTFYHTEKDVIPDNPDADFLTGNAGLSLRF